MYRQLSLVQISQVKDLGMLLTNSLTPTLQYHKAANKAMQVMGTIRSFKYLTKESFLLVHTLSIACLLGVLI